MSTEKGSIHTRDPSNDAQRIEILKPQHVDLAESDEIKNIPTGYFIWLVAFTASTGGMLFGYDTGIISAVLVYLYDDLGHPLSANEKELITSLCSAGACIGSIIAGLTADRYGRKGAIYVGCLLFTVGAVLQASASSLPQMAVGRLIVGFGVGSAAMIVPMYIAELAPTKYRGRMMGLNNMSITGGQVISYGIGAAFASVPHGWRYMVGLGGVPSIILALCLPFCPESPRQLIYHDRHEEARTVIQRIHEHATPDQVTEKIQLIEAAVQEARILNEGRGRLYMIKQLHTNPAYFRALVCACGLSMNFLSNSIFYSNEKGLMYYSGSLFALVGFANPVAVGLVVSGTNLLMTWVNMMVVDPWGRRRVLVTTVWGMSVGLLAVAVAFRFLPVNLETLELEGGSQVTTPAIVVLVFIIWFVFFYGVSVGNTAWMSADFFAMEVRAMGTMYMTCCCWASNLIVSSTFLSMMKTMTPSGTFGFYAALCFVGWILILFFYPEVSGLSLEEIGEVFSHGFGVSYARTLRKERRQLSP